MAATKGSDKSAGRGSIPPAGGRDTDALGAVTVAHGPEELLAERAAAAAVAAVRQVDPDADVTDVDAGELHAGGLAELTSPSLFAASRALLVRDAGSLPAETVDALVSYARHPQPYVAVVLLHRGGQKGRAIPDKLKKAGARVISCASPKAWELPKFVVQEVRLSGGKISEEAAGVLVDSVGSDLRSLTSAVAQLLADTSGSAETAGTAGSDGTAGAVVDEELIRRYFAGRAEVSGFAVADAVVAGRRAVAVEQLRWALRTGVAPVLLTSALASGLRGLAKLSGAPRGLGEGELAKTVGAPPWKIKTMRSQLRGWTEDGLAHALRVAARADAEVKGAADDAGYALERAVLDIMAARQARD